MSEPLVSFIIPVLNGEKHIARCLQSIRNQQFPTEQYEVLILDNGSTDRTPQIIRKLGFEFQVIPSAGVSALRNQGVKQSLGSYLAFVDADMELAPNWLQYGLISFEDCKVVAVGCFPLMPPKPTWLQKTLALHRHARYPDRQEVQVAWLGAANLLIRRNDFLAVGGFSERLETTEDTDLCYRLGQRGVILHNPGMAAIHWGEEPDLKTFWRKEIWRGKGNLKGVLSHGLRWDELPSLGYPFYMAMCGLLFMVGLIADIQAQTARFVPLSCILSVLPALVLALRTAHLVKQLTAIPRLFVLYFVYGIARMVSLIKYNTHKYSFSQPADARLSKL
jgi:GT2 family glycosyltransferase